MEKQLTRDDLEHFQRQLNLQPNLVVAQNAVTRADVKEVMAKRSVTSLYNNDFSVKLPEMKATAQKSSGRCWLFAACNVMRAALRKKFKLKDSFELSQNYLFFYDKIERANYFIEAIFKTLDDELEGRLISHLLTDPLCDGGQWDMVVNLVEKYGIVPKTAYPEAFASTNSRTLNRLLTAKLREYACKIRKQYQNGLSVDKLREQKGEMMTEFYNMVAVQLGTPPSRFTWRVETSDDKFVVLEDITPLEFYNKHIDFDCSEHISLVHDPRNDYEALFTVDLLGNVVNGARPEVRYVNLPIDELRRMAIELIDKGQPVWFGCDVGKEYHRGMAMMDDNLFDYKLTLGCDFALDKAERLRYGQSLMTHAMVFTGYDKAEGADRPSKWRVENSWGDTLGDKGFFTMTDTWFDEYLYQIIVPKSMLSEERQKLLEEDKVVHLPPWDPMGALA